MDQAQLIGYLVLAVTTLSSFVAVVRQFTQPINELKVVIQELKDCIAQIRADSAAQNKRIAQQGREIDDLKGRINVVETKIAILHKEEI